MDEGGVLALYNILFRRGVRKRIVQVLIWLVWSVSALARKVYFRFETIVI